jgi:hypothetical protein
MLSLIKLRKLLRTAIKNLPKCLDCFLRKGITITQNICLDDYLILKLLMCRNYLVFNMN